MEVQHQVDGGIIGALTSTPTIKDPMGLYI